LHDRLYHSFWEQGEGREGEEGEGRKGRGMASDKERKIHIRAGRTFLH